MGILQVSHTLMVLFLFGGGECPPITSLEPAEDSSGPPARLVDLVKLLVLPGEGPHGRWERGEGFLKAKRITHGATGFLIRYEPGDVYDLRMLVQSGDGQRKLVIGLPVSNRHYLVELSGGNTTTDGARLPSGRPVRIHCNVRKGSVLVRVDGKQVIEWRGDPSRLSLPKELGSIEPGLPFVTLSKGEFSFTKIGIEATRGRVCEKSAGYLLNAALRRAYEEQMQRER